MTPKEEYTDKLQNVGASVFIIGAFGCLMAGNIVTLLICYGLCLVGTVLIYGAGFIVDKLEEREKRKK